MKSEYLFELSGENIDFAKYEIIEVLKTEKYHPNIKFDELNIICLEVSKDLSTRVINRLGMTKRVSKIIFCSTYKGNITNFIDKIEKIDIGEKSFAIRLLGSKNISEKNVAIQLGEKISKNNMIDLTKPDVKILIYVGKYIAISIFEKHKETAYKQCLKHHIKNRPYFSPISIHPRISRAMVNVSKAKKNSTIIDPFCGTGGILIEAAHMKMKVIGIDILPKMVQYTNGNLEHFGFEGYIIENDVNHILKLNFDAAVCDPPYGLSTTTKGEDLKHLMNRTINIFSEKLIKGQRLVMALSKPEFIKNKKFTIKEQFKWYIHKSLTRNIIILQKN